MTKSAVSSGLRLTQIRANAPIYFNFAQNYTANDIEYLKMLK